MDHSPRDDGFSLVEVLIAVLVLSTAAAGVARLCAIAAASRQAARGQTWAALLAMDKLEQLHGLQWRFDAAGAPLADTSTDVSAEPAAAGGPGLSPSPADAIERNVTGYVDYLDGAGGWIGHGAHAPPGTVYVRRWSVQPLPDDPFSTLVFQVLVMPAGLQGRPAPPRARRPGTALLIAVRTRKGQ